MSCKPCPKVEERADNIYGGYLSTGRIGNQRVTPNHAINQARLIALREERADSGQVGYAERITVYR